MMKVWEHKFDEEWNAYVEDKDNFGILHLLKDNRKMYSKMVLKPSEPFDSKEWISVCEEYMKK